MKQEIAEKMQKCLLETVVGDTPQQINLVKHGFAHLASKGHAIMTASNLPLKKRYLLSKECLQTKHILDGFTSVTVRGVMKTQYKHFGQKIPKFIQGICTIGEACTMKFGSDGKIDNEGVSFLGYALDHERDCYQMFDPGTEQFIKTCDVTWAK